MQKEDYIRIEKSKALVRLSPRMVFATGVFGVLTACVLMLHYPIIQLLLWLVFYSVFIGIRWLLLKNYTVDSIDLENSREQLRRFVFGSFLNGLGWSSVIIFFHDPEAIKFSLFLTLLCIGYISIAGSSTSLHMPSFYAFSVTATLIFSLTFLYQGGDFALLVGGGLIYFLATISVFTRYNQINFEELKGLEYDNQSLLTQVIEQKDIAEGAVLAKNKFLAAASHDLRQPLHAMNLYSDVLLSRLKDPFNIDIIGKINSSSTALNDLLHDLLDISRLDASVVKNRPQHIELKEIIMSIEYEFSAHGLESDVMFMLDIDDEQIAYIDPILFERVLRNLVSNAFKYTLEGHVKLIAKPVGSKIKVSIIDTGIGISKDHIHDIFSEFTQVGNPERDRNKGLGLGLSIVKRLCDVLNIELKFESELGKGTQVDLIIDQGERALMPIVASSHVNNIEQLNVLFIDDEIDVRDGMELLLKVWQCRPLIADSGHSALSIVRESNVKIDIIISDLRLRENESGVEVIESIREELNEIVPAIIVTGDTSVDRIELVRDADNIILVHKPIKAEELREIVNDILSV